jgi:hypothetical protein
MDDDVVVVRGVGCNFISCERAASGDQFHRSMIALLMQLGVRFHKIAPYPAPIDPHPEEQLEPDGSLIGSINASFHLLAPADPSWNTDGCFEGQYGNVGAPKQSFRMRSLSLRDDFREFRLALQDLANGRREFLKLLIPYVKPRLAYADDTWGGGGVKEQQVQAADLRRLFWVTYFGPHYVENYGKEFFMNTPAWSVEELDGGVFITVTETFLDFAENEPKETLKYLKQKFKDIRANRFKIHSAF